MNYPKINTLFKRDLNGLIIPAKYSLPEFETLANIKWECTEKIDGTNIHIDICWYEDNTWDISYHGRTERAEIPKHLLNKLKQMFDNINPNDIFSYDDTKTTYIRLFGEGYGMKIQNGGNYIKDDVNFILFDININGKWLNRSSLEDIAKKLNIDIVPLMGYYTIPEAIEIVAKGFKSTIAENNNYDAEGFILKTQDGLLNSRGERIITKLKTCDFIKYEKAMMECLEN